MILPITSDVAPKDAFPEARAGIARALELELDSAEAHNSDATIKFWFDWDFNGAEAAAQEGISLNSTYSLAHLYLAHILSNVGRHDESLAAIQRARMLDPFSLITNAMYGQFLYHAGQAEESIDQALAACDKAREFSGGNSQALSLAGYIHAVSGEKAKAETKIPTTAGAKEGTLCASIQSGPGVCGIAGD
jgi:tetratricopeptide (TPR) repeat protein